MKKAKLRRILSRHERAVCLRVKDIREMLKLSQVELAAQLNISRKAVGSYEECRVALRYDLALKLCRQFIISERWLAIGQGPVRQFMDLASEPLPASVIPGSRFTDAYRSGYGKLYDDLRRQYAPGIRMVLQQGSNYDYLENLLLYLLSVWRSTLEKPVVNTLYAFLIEQGFDFASFVHATGRMPEPKDLSELPQFKTGSKPAMSIRIERR